MRYIRKNKTDKIVKKYNFRTKKERIRKQMMYEELWSIKETELKVEKS